MSLRGVAFVLLAGSLAAQPAADVVFSSTRDGTSGIYVLEAATQKVRPVSRPADGDNWPVWSPDGRRIAFQRRTAGKFDIWIMNSDGSEARRLTDDPDHDYLPSWTPDGRGLIFLSWRKESGDAERQPHFYSMRDDGGGQRRLPLASPRVSGAAEVSPDGARLIFTRKLSETDAVLFTAHIDGSDERQLTRADGAFHGSPAWSPDGESVAYYRDGGKGISTIELMRSDGSGGRTLVATGQNWYPRWSADGQWLLLTAMKPGGAKDDVELFAVRTDGGGELHPLASSPKREAEGSWRPPPRR